MKIFFVDTPPLLDWDPSSKFTKGGRRYPGLSVTGEKTYNYLVLQTISVLREIQGFKDLEFIDAQVRGYSVAKLIEYIAERKPEMIVMYIEQIKFNVDLFLINELKKRINTFVVFVGPLATAMDKEIIEKYPAVDCVCRGEFDYIIGEIAECVSQNKNLDEISGITFRKEGQVIKSGPSRHVEDLDRLPFPAYDLIKFNDYTESVFVELPTATMITSRGCPHQCIYCWFPQTMYSHKWRAQSPERVVSEIEYLVNNFGVKEIRIDDDIYELDKKRVMDICRLIIERKIKISYAPQCRADLLDEEMIKMLKSSGCSRIMIGNESGNQMILDKIKKKLDLKDTARIVKLLKKYKIDVHTCFMIGFPWDSEETIRDTIKFACALNTEFCQITIATPLPGTEYYRMVKANGNLITEDLSKYDGFSSPVVKYDHLTKEKIAALEIEAYRKYFLRPRYFAMMFLRMFRSAAYFFQMLRFARAFWRRKIAGWI